MDALKLKKYAELLEVAIQTNLHKSEDVKFLATYPLLTRAIADAKAGTIDAPRDLGGLGRWILDQSNIPSFEDLSNQLSAFSILLRGWDLPNESGVEK